MSDLIRREDVMALWEKYHPYIAVKAIEFGNALKEIPPAQPKEVIPYRNYKYLSDYWCQCGWHLGKKGEVKYCSNCGRKVNWDE